jgi:hypothetical protein
MAAADWWASLCLLFAVRVTTSTLGERLRDRRRERERERERERQRETYR